MLLTVETLNEFGYTIESVSDGSNKKVCIKCDYCGNKFTNSMKIRNKSNSVVKKDACVKCKFKKRDDVNLANYGVKNPCQLNSVKEKIKQANIEKYGAESYTQTKEFKNKSDETKLKKYGTTNIMTVKSIRDNQKASMMKNYGVDNPTKSKIIKDKIRETNLERYGVTSPLSLDKFRDKSKETSLEKYGTEYPCQSDEIKAKIKETNLFNIGVAYPMQSKLVMDKAKKTNVEKYGVENVFQSEKIKEKIKNTIFETYGVDNPSKLDEIKNKIKETRIKNGNIKIYNNKTMKEWSDELDKNYVTFKDHVRKFGFEIALKTKIKESGLETFFKSILNKYDIEYQQHARIENRITDFLLEKYNLVIEVDGDYWHSDANKNMTDKKYHMKKQKVYSEVGYDSMFFREHEIALKPKIVESMFVNRIGLNVNRVFARKCDIVKLTAKESKNFFKENHMMGHGHGVTFALKYNEEIVSAIQIKNNSKNDYEISRFSNKNFTTVVGGFSRLLKHVEKTINMDSLKTFIDLRYGRGLYLIDFGFKHIGTHLSFKWVNGLMYANRTKFLGKTGYEQGFNKLYDCGQAKFLKLYK